MDMRISDPPQPKLGELLERLVDEGGNLLHAEVRIAEAKLTRRMRLAAIPLGQLAAATALALIALMALATALVVALAPVVGFLAATLLVAVAAGGLGYVLYRRGRDGLQEVFEMPSLITEEKAR